MKKFFTLPILLLAFSIGSLAGNPLVSNTVVISQVYGGSGCATPGCSTFKNDYIEIFNRGLSIVDINGWSVQYASAAGTTWTVTTLATSTFMLQPGQYFLIQQAAGPNGVNNIPAADAAGTITMSATAGKVALVSNNTPLIGACPTSAAIIDLVGYGTTANCNEGSNAPAPGTTTADVRGSGGCTETDNNGTDFAATTPNPRNSTSPFGGCNVVAVSLPDFSATKSGNRANLYWLANCTSASVSFELLRSGNGTDFKSIYSTVASQQRCAAPFNYIDANVAVGKNFYRLKITDTEGRVSYSKTILVINSTDEESLLSIRPTIVNTRIYVYYASALSGNIMFTITDMQGRTVKKITLPVLNGENKFSIPVADIAKGQYQLQGFSPTGSTVAARFIKQ